MIGPSNGNNLLTFDFGVDRVPNTESGTLFHLPRHCGVGILGDLLAFVTQSVTSRFSRTLAR